MEANVIKDFVKEYFDEINANVFFSSNDDLVSKLVKISGFNLDIEKNNSTDIFTFFSVVGTEKNDVDIALVMYIGNKKDSGFFLFYLWEILENKINILPVLSSIISLQPNLDKISIINAISAEILFAFRNSFHKDIRVFLDKNNFHFEET